MRDRYQANAFSLIEIIVVVAVIGILSSLIISMISGTSQHASEVIARQQQAELQTALGNWISSAASEPGGLATARSRYAAAANKLSLLSNYLQESTYLRLSNTGTEVRSDALIASKARLHFSQSWSPTTTPTVTWSNVQ